METDLEKFDEFIEKENIDPFKLVEALLNRALARAYTEDYIKNYAEYPKGISDDLVYIQFDSHELEFFESTYYYSDSVTINSKQAFVKKEPDHHLTLKEALRKEEEAEKHNKDREKQQNEAEVQWAIEKLKSTGLSNEQILERIKNGSKQTKINK